MSHIVEIKTQVRDCEAIAAACRRLGLAEPTRGTAKLYSAEAAGVIVKLPEWQYPIVIDTASGSIQFDHFNGSWGDPAKLDQFLQAYAVELVRLEARKKGHTVTETQLQDGSIRVQIVEG
jgi:hypothetical protein